MSTPGRHDVSPDFWNLNWSAIWAGAGTMLALFLILALIGIGIEFSAHTTYAIKSRAGMEWFTTITATWLAALALVALLLGGWVTGRIHRFGLRSVWIHGLILWSLAALFSLAVLAGTVPLASRAAQYFSTAESLADDMHLLAEPQYKNEVLAVVQHWQPEKHVIPELVSTQTAEREDPNSVLRDPDLRAYVQQTTRWTDPQLDTFLASNEYDLAKAREHAKARWQEQHQTQLAAADGMRSFIASSAWALSSLAVLGLAAALGGTTLGRVSRVRAERYRTA